MPACPRCGRPVPVSTGRRGRPRVWCSDDCRRRANEEGQRVHEVVRERVVERLVYVPHNPISAVELVLRDIDAVQLLLQRLTDQARTEPETDLERVQRRQVHKLAPIVDQLAYACRPPTTPPPTPAPPHPDWNTTETYEDGWLAVEPAPSEPPPARRPNRNKRRRKRKRR